MGKTSTLLVAVVVLLGLAAVAGVAGQLIHVSSTTSMSASSSSQLRSNAQATAEPGCNYTISQQASDLVAVGYPGYTTRTYAGNDIGPFLNELLAAHETLCVTPGVYLDGSEIQISHLSSVTLRLDSGATIRALGGNRMLLVLASPKTVISGGQWVGSGGEDSSGIRVLYGSNGTVIQNVEISNTGEDGIFVYNYIRPSANVSILDCYVHNTGRYGIQEYSSTPARMGALISGNTLLDNRAGGIYTNGAEGVTITHNVVRNTVGNGPGEIGIGVTNAQNDTVTFNQVDHMAWFGIQAFYNDYTIIANNTSTFNAGGLDQSGITNDHSSFSKVVGNTVTSNGKFGVYVERSWNVTISGNLADRNGGYGIGLHHGDQPTTGRSLISGNICSFNGFAGIVLNSAVGNLVSMNQCNNNSGDGILLYNDPGQAGSTGNTISGNLLGNEAGSPRTQMFGIREVNDSGNNTIASNTMTDNTAAATSLLGPDVQNR